MAGFECRDIHCDGWTELLSALDKYREATVTYSWEGEVETSGWIFRGQRSEHWDLEPSVERLARSGSAGWAVVEARALATFAAKAPFHLERHLLSQLEDPLLLCSLARHYGVPTRLLDFTYSPFLAVYFALREQLSPAEKDREACVWMLDLGALMRGAESVLRTMRWLDENGRPVLRNPISLNPDMCDSELDRAIGHERFWQEAAAAAMSPPKAHRARYNETGLVVPYLPRQHNPRLSCQQGLFLLNAATDKTLKSSLLAMMSRIDEPWCQRIVIARGTERQILKQLFRMNIHDLSVYPDSYGLARFVELQTALGLEQPDDSAL